MYRSIDFNTNQLTTNFNPMPASTQHQANTLDLTQKHRSSYNPSPKIHLNHNLENNFGAKKKL